MGFWLSGFRNYSPRWEENHNTTYEYYAKDNTCDHPSCPYRNEKEYNGNYVQHFHHSLSNMYHKKEVYSGLSFRIGISF